MSLAWVLGGLALASVHAADPVVRWNALALDAVRFANTPPPAAARHLAILHAAVFDAVNGLGGPYVACRFQANAPAGALPEAAAAAASGSR